MKAKLYIAVWFQALDLTTYRLIYDGPLTLKLGDTKRFKTIDLHVVLLEDCIMLLQKQDDKYLLKFHTSTVGNAAVGSQGHKFCHSPVIKFSAMLVRPVATGKSMLDLAFPGGILNDENDDKMFVINSR